MPFEDDAFQTEGGGLGPDRFQTEESGEDTLTGTITDDYFTTMYLLMKAIKHNLKKYRMDTGMLQIGSGEINWGLGYVMPRTIFPAIAIFPLEKKFNARRGGGRSIVEYTLSVDLYSKKTSKAEQAKVWTLKAVEDAKTCLRRTITMPDEYGKKHCFDCRIVGTDIAEAIEDSHGSFQSVASLRVTCFAYHQMNVNRLSASELLETDTNSFYEKVCRALKLNYSGTPFVAHWMTGIAKPIMHSPTVIILPENEEYRDDVYTNNRDVVNRPISITVAMHALPTLSLLRASMAIADNLVCALEKDYQVGGYAMDGRVNTITYRHANLESGFEFYSIVDGLYECIKQHTIIVR
jgi:hypothetical protein